MFEDYNYMIINAFIFLNYEPLLFKQLYSLRNLNMVINSKMFLAKIDN